MTRRKISELRKALKPTGVRLQASGPNWHFVNSMGRVLFLVDQNDLFDCDGNRFLNDDL
jgi:hypothetical protein